MADSAGHDQADVREVPVTIQGAKHVQGSEQRQIFAETTKTTIVFDNGAVVNLSAKLAQGQCVFLRNELSGREILCKVLEWRQVAESGYADLEFTTRDPKFWDAPPTGAVAVPAAAPVAVVAPRSVEALDLLPASAPNPVFAANAEASARSSTEIHAAAAAIEAPALHTAEELEEAEETLAESDDDTEDDAELNDTKDAELLAKLIAADSKRKPKRESAAAETKITTGDAKAENAPEHGETNAYANDQREAQGDASDGRRAALIAKLTPWVHRLHRLTYGKGAMGVGIAASVLLVLALGFGWHAHRSAIRNKNRASAAVAQAKQNARTATAQTTPGAAGKSGAEVETRADGNISKVTRAQAAQKIPEQTGAPSVPSVAASIVPSATPKLEARESGPGAKQEPPEQTRLRHGNAPNHGATSPARIVSQSPAAIPPWAKGMDTDGVVKLDVLIDEKGNLRETKPLSGPRLLQHAAERAVALWIFEPARTDGKPTATHMVLTVQFQR
jgi:hypothetical protein